MSLLQICPEKLKSIAELASEVISDRRAKTIMQLKNNGLVTWPQKGAKITLPRGPGLASSHRWFSMIIMIMIKTLPPKEGFLVLDPRAPIFSWFSRKPDVGISLWVYHQNIAAHLPPNNKKVNKYNEVLTTHNNTWHCTYREKHTIFKMEQYSTCQRRSK